MRACWLILLLAWTVANASADTRLPGSTSPDGRVALYYAPLPPAGGSHSFEFYLRDPRTQKPLSGQLVPAVGVVNAPTDADFSTELLFQRIGDDAERMQSGEQRDAAFSYAVVWSPDSRCVAIEGGAHKFWHLKLSHRVKGSFQGTDLPPGDAFVDYYRAQSPHPRVKQAGVERKLRRRSGEFPDRPSYVCWLNNRTLAVSTYPYLLKEEDYPGKFGGEPFFMLDLQGDSVPAIRGFCW